MKTYKAILLCIALVACNTNSNSFSQSDLTPEKIIEKFFGLYDSEGAQNALEFILSTNRWVNEDSNELKTSFQNLTGQLGSYHGNELITKRSIGENYTLWSYMIKYDRQPIRFNFIFYRPSEKWQLQDFRYDDDLDIELIEAANAYRLTENLPGNSQ
ncbi:MAG: hypothetical protein HC819_22340 [Cyclobacteriaceae bacterium]|nr:hypothetical protein [Cyclobacteriaceae bacterium]